MAEEELTLSPGLSCVSFLITSPSSPSVQAASVALADTGPIPVTLPAMIDTGRAHTVSCFKCGHTPQHPNHLTAPGFILGKASHGLQAFQMIGVKHRASKPPFLTCLLPDIQKLAASTSFLPWPFSHSLLHSFS